MKSFFDKAVAKIKKDVVENKEELKENMADAIKMVVDYKKEETRKLYAGKKIFRRRVAVL